MVFFIFLYQRWIYRVDPKRVNEFGISQEMLEMNGQTPQTGGGAAIEGGDAQTSEPQAKTDEEKKTD